MRTHHAHMEAFYLGRGAQALYCGVGAKCETAAETWAAWKQAKKHAVPLDRAPFIIDYHNRRGDLVDTIGLDRAGFERVTGERARDLRYYRRVNGLVWRKAKEAA